MKVKFNPAVLHTEMLDIAFSGVRSHRTDTHNEVSIDLHGGGMGMIIIKMSAAEAMILVARLQAVLRAP